MLFNCLVNRVSNQFKSNQIIFNSGSMAHNMHTHTQPNTEQTQKTDIYIEESESNITLVYYTIFAFSNSVMVLARVRLT